MNADGSEPVAPTKTMPGSRIRFGIRMASGFGSQADGGYAQYWCDRNLAVPPRRWFRFQSDRVVVASACWRNSGEDYLYFSSRYGRFSYDENPVSGLWRVVRLNRTDGQLRTIVHGPGSAVRPWLSPDQKELYFVSRDRSKTLLEVANLETGQRRTIADWLDADQMEGFALHGLYPAFDWVDDSGQELVIWAGGKIWRLNVETGQRTEIPFRVKGNWTFHEVVRPQNQISDTVQANIIRWPSLHADGRLAFSALGMLWIRQPDGRIERVSESTGLRPPGVQTERRWRGPVFGMGSLASCC